jgi:hypothetical protein
MLGKRMRAVIYASPVLPERSVKLKVPISRERRTDGILGEPASRRGDRVPTIHQCARQERVRLDSLFHRSFVNDVLAAADAVRLMAYATINGVLAQRGVGDPSW